MTSVDESKEQAERARAKLEATLDTVRRRTRPEALLGSAKDEAKKQALKVGAAALANGRFRPVLALGIAATSIAYLFRNPLLKALNKRLGEGEKHD
ncbi:MAG: hypothetical protein U1E64_13605 [Sphingomonadaceae bacterium]|jgi:ElaB/YqjD/DUF883 family membrane-anchored ribosome-binding protein|uniref:hypothetical protein n=1 Tax=Aquisediminimonas profunda TaxID=1550733 RepID=UPI001C62A7E7|nr:hypothetical protein [Aquisediminimonas profunda]